MTACINNCASYDPLRESFVRRLATCVVRKAAALWLLLPLVFLHHVEVVRADIYRYVDEHGVIHFSNVPATTRYHLYFPETKLSIKSYFTRYDKIIDRAARLHGVDSCLVKAVIKAESDFNERAVSRAGAEGLMQLMPETANELAVNDSFDPNQNIRAGVRYLKRQLRSFQNNVPLALAAYNAGESVVRRYGSIPPFEETRVFVDRVLHYWDEFNLRRSRRP
ncbi:MAG: transglycosylase SLT domain-containing protein [Deltaproteobacteria bacterium]|nr:MAG: transglycosylase SLT domain-containing protein [Deltaproteobacteria bacterium]